MDYENYSVEGKPGSILRGLCTSALVYEGLAGTNYNLSDISTTCYIAGKTIHISFWDMNKNITNKNPYFEDLKREIINTIDNQ